MKKRLIEIILYVLVVLGIVLPWFFHSGYLFFTDFVLGPTVHLDWTSVSSLIFHFFAFFLPVAFVQKLFIMATLFVVLLGGKKIASVILTKNPLLVFVTSLFFLFNPFVYDRMGYGQFGIIAALGFMAFAAGYLLEYLEKKQSKQILLAGLFSGLSILFANHFIFFNAVFYALFLLMIAIKHKEYFRKKLVRDLLLALLIILAFNLNWLMGIFLATSSKAAFLSSGITKQDFVAFQTVGKNAWQALSNVLLLGGFWGKDQHRYIDLMALRGNWGRSLIILSPLMLFGIYSAFKSRKTRNLVSGLLIIFLIALFLALGIRTGIGEKVTYFLFDHLPFYKGLRETQKWVSLIVICYGIFLAWGIRSFFSTKLAKKHSTLFVAIIIIIIIMQAPLMIWGMMGQFKPANYPKDWQETDKIIMTENKKCDKKILFLPWHLYMSFNFAHGVVASPAAYFFQCPVISGANMEWGGIYDNSKERQGELINNWIITKGNYDVLNNSGLDISYIILAKETDWKNYSWLDHLSGLELMKDSNDLRVYRVKK